MFACEYRTFIVFLSLFFHTFTTVPLGFYSYISTQRSSGYELPSGILYVTYAALCRCRPIIT